MEELDSCTSATERYDAFNAMRNRFGGEKKGYEAQKTTTVVSVARRPSRKSDSLSFVKPPIALVQGESESASQEAQERIAKAKEMAVSSATNTCSCDISYQFPDDQPGRRAASRLSLLAQQQCGNGARALPAVAFPLIYRPVWKHLSSKDRETCF